MILNRIAKRSGSSWSPLGTGMNGRVWVLEVLDDGSGPALYAGGEFTTAGGVSAIHVAKWDGTTWTALGSGLGTVYALTVFDDGGGPALYAGGANFVVRWDGSSWSSFGGISMVDVHALTVFDDGGGPELYGGVTRYHDDRNDIWYVDLLKWDGALWRIVIELQGTQSPFTALTTFDDGSGSALFVGVFDGFDSGVYRYRGGSSSYLGGPLAYAFAAFDDASGPALYAGGFDGYSAKWNGSSWSSLGGGTNGTVRSLAVFDDGGGADLIVGGEFTSALDSHDSFIAEWQACTDRTAPTISCPSGLIVVDDRSSPGEIVDFTVTATDPCNAEAPTVVCVPPSGSFFPRGKTLVTAPRRTRRTSRRARSRSRCRSRRACAEAPSGPPPRRTPRLGLRRAREGNGDSCHASRSVLHRPRLAGVSSRLTPFSSLTAPS